MNDCIQIYAVSLLTKHSVAACEHNKLKSYNISNSCNLGTHSIRVSQSNLLWALATTMKIKA